MKLRSGFVSNSSSSSFIVTGDEITPEKLVISIDISKMGHMIRNEDDIEDYVYGDRKKKEVRELLAAGKSVFFGDIDNNLSEALTYIDSSLEADVDY